MARKSRKNVMLQENTALPDKEKKVLFKAGLYARLSHEKEENIERGTIETQMELMKNYVKDHEDIVIEEEYYDASFTGTNFERPDFQRMLEDAKTGRINCIIVKDLSRLGRNYVEMGNYIERVFPFLNVRFIAVTDDFDSFRPGTDLMMPLKNIVNEFYAKDISKKVSTAHRRKWTTDEYMCGFAPYGYLKSKTEKNRIVVDEATAGNVRLIYKLFLEGKGYTPIAICITKISTFLILCDLAVCLATLYVSFSLVFALMRYLQGKVFLIRFYSPTTLSSSRAEFRLPSRLACA